MAAHSTAQTTSSADLRYAQYIGRVGALAVALGIGAAIATGHGIGLGVAYADDPSPNTSQDDGDTGGNGDDGSTDGTLTSPATDLEKAEESGHPRSPLGRLANIPRMIFNATGGAQTSGVTKPRPQLPKLRTVLDDIATGVNDDAHDSTEQPQGAAPQFNSNSGSHVYAPTGKQSADNDAPAIASIPTRVVDQFRTSIAPPTDRLHAVKTPLAQVFGTKNADVSDVQSFAGQRHMTPTVDTEDEQPVGPLGVLSGNHMGVVNTVLAVAVAPFLKPNPAAPQDPPLLLGVLAWARREIQRTFCNTAPRAVGDNFETAEDGELSGNVLTNDVDADLHDVKTVASHTEPEHGDLVLNDDGTFTYTPDDNYNGPDSFTYTVTDETSPWHVHGGAGFLFGGGHTSAQTATVNITVTPVDDQGTADPYTTSVAEDSHVDIETADLLANIHDIDGETQITGVTPTTNTHGGVVLNTNGTITYTPTANYNGPASFTYTATDQFGGTTTGLVNITVTPVDDALAQFDTVAINTGGSPTDIVISPDGKRAYVANLSGNTVTVIDVDPASPTYNQVIDTNPALAGVQGITVGSTPHTLAITPDGKRLYVTHYTAGNYVSVVDLDPTSTNYQKLIDTDPVTNGVQNIPVGTNPAGIAINQSGTRAYVANSNGASVSVIDIDPTSGTYNQVIDADLSSGGIDTIAVPNGPFKVAVSPDGKRIYVSNITDSSVSVIDIDPTSPTYHKLIDTNPAATGANAISVGSVPQGIAVTPGPNGARAYVVNTNLDTVTVIDIDPNSPNYNKVVDTNPMVAGVQNISVGDAPNRIAISPDGKRAYVTNVLGNNVAVIDIDPASVTYNQVIDTNPATVLVDAIPVGSSPGGIAITPDGTRAYVTTPGTGTVTMIYLGDDNAAVDPTFDTYNVGTGPIDSVVVGHYLYASNYDGGNTVTVVDLNTNTKVDTDPTTPGVEGITVGSGPVSIAHVGRYLYVSNFLSNSVSVIDTSTNTVVDTDPTASGVQDIPVGSGPNFMVAVGDKVYVANQNSRTVTVIDTLTNTRVDTDTTIAGTQDIPVGNFGITHSGTRVYVTDFSDNSVNVIDSVTDTISDTDPVSAGTQHIGGGGLTGPEGVAVVGSKLYAANLDGTVSVFDLSDNTAVQQIAIPGGGQLLEMAVKGDRLYVASANGGVAVIDTTSNTYIQTIPTGAWTWGLNIEGNYLYATNRSDGTVTAIDISPPVV